MSSLPRPLLPEFRNLGVILRIVLMAEALRFAVAYIGGSGPAVAFDLYLRQGAVFAPALLSMLLLLFLVGPQLKRLAYWRAVAILYALVAAWFWLWNRFPGSLPSPASADRGLHDLFGAFALVAVLLAYFDWRHRRLSPAVADARLMALQARIQPHFLYNSLNTVLGLIREDPRKAETVLENLADLFRAILAETRSLIPLAQELELAKAYAEIEAIRLGPRLTVVWQCDDACLDCPVPQLILQPLIENAIRHGIEPREQGGTVTVIAKASAERLQLGVRNPVGPADSRPGHQIALDNIRERLALHYDVEASLDIEQGDGEFAVDIGLPYRHATAR